MIYTYTYTYIYIILKGFKMVHRKILLDSNGPAVQVGIKRDLNTLNAALKELEVARNAVKQVEKTLNKLRDENAGTKVTKQQLRRIDSLLYDTEDAVKHIKADFERGLSTENYYEQLGI